MPAAAANSTALPAADPIWVEASPGAKPGDCGPRIDAIVRREMLNVYQSTARLSDGSRVTYNHPSMLCETRQGTLIFMWNGGPSEGESGNRIFFSRREKDSSTWSEPERLEIRQIDFGAICQPSRKDAPVIAGYWLGPPRASGAALRWSFDDGKTWTDRMEFPAADDSFWSAAPARGRYRFSMSPPVEFPDIQRRGGLGEVINPTSRRRAERVELLAKFSCHNSRTVGRLGAGRSD